MHESTISRVTTQKYLHSPRGIFELKYFFPVTSIPRGGGEASSTAIQCAGEEINRGGKPSETVEATAS